MRRMILLLVPLLIAAEPMPPKAGILFPVPTITPVVVHDPAPDPKTDQSALLEDEFYVISSPEEFWIRCVPMKSPLIDITYQEGPLNIRAKFFDGDGKYETRKFTDTYLVLVNATKGALGAVDLIGIPKGVDTEDKIQQTTLKIGNGPRPPPEPDVDVDPEPDTDTIPAPVGFRVIFKYEKDDLTPEHSIMMGGDPRIVDYLNDRCAKDAEGYSEWRAFDKDIQFKSGASPSIKALWETSNADAQPLPKVVIAVNGKARVFPFPENGKMLELLKKWGG